VQRLHEALQQLSVYSPAVPLRVALSGGIDSVVLLHGLAALRADRLVGELDAVHVDHGLHPDSAAWAAACASHCAELGVALRAVNVTVPRCAGDSPEAAARAVRYAALADGLEHGQCLLTAHHGDDQMETVLLQLLRGAGPAGLAAMPACRAFADGWLIRPLLDFTRAELETWAQSRGLVWQEDPSNEDCAPGRNYLRHKVVPALRQRWPAVAASLGRSAGHCAEAQRLLEDLGAIDLEAVAKDDGLRAEALAQLSEARQRNLLRLWLRRRGLPLPGVRRLQTLVEDLIPARRDASAEVSWPGASVRKYRDRLFALDASQLKVLAHQPEPSVWHDVAAPLALGLGMGQLNWVSDPAGGVDGSWLEQASLEVRYRRRGEQIEPAGGGHHRRLKTLFQAIGIPPWWRAHVPLVFAQNRLLAVADRWLSGEALAAPGQAGWRLCWEQAPLGAGRDCDRTGVLVI